MDRPTGQRRDPASQSADDKTEGLQTIDTSPIRTHALPDNNPGQNIYWGHPRIGWQFILRMNEENQGKLKFILQNSNERSMHSLLMKEIERFTEERVNALLAAGHIPDKP